MTIASCRRLQFRDNAAVMTGHPHPTRVAVVGAGIVGLATARALRAQGHQVTVLDKEPEVARHQSGRNSGVVHAGLYYRPGSLKAQLCTAGREALEAYCEDAGIPLERCGKVVVATSVGELDRLAALRERGRRNGLTIQWLDRRGLADHEPYADGVAALFVPATGVVDFARVSRALRDELVRDGVAIELGHEVVEIVERREDLRIVTSSTTFECDRLVNCGGLHADEIAIAAGLEPSTRIVPFRGEYMELRPERSYLVRHLIYPVPDPSLPFLGVHLSRGVDGHVHVGPNAVLALAREGYTRRDVDRAHVAALVRDPRMWQLARRWWRTGLAEIARSWSRRLFAREVARLVPDVRADDLVPAGSGVRAQAVAEDGSLVDDFALVETPRSLHVLNAPSPGATASLALGRWIADRLSITTAPG